MRNQKGQFAKGNKERIGAILSETTKDKIRKKTMLQIKENGHPMTGKKHNKSSRKKMSEWQIGRKLSKETREKMSKVHKRIGSKPPSNLGKKHSIETRRKIGEAKRGEKSHFWKGGITPINLAVRCSLEYKLWREAVFERDNYTCQECGDNRGGNLEAHHLKPFSLFPELRFVIDNGITLCKDCHKKTETYGNRKININKTGVK